MCCHRVQAMEVHLRARPELLPAVLTTLFELVLFEDVSNQWSLSRPMLALILVNEVRVLSFQVPSSFRTSAARAPSA